jgi:serine protease Do
MPSVRFFKPKQKLQNHMMNKPKNLRRLLLGSAVSLIAFPLVAFAADDAPEVESEHEVKVMSHTLAVAPNVEKDVRVIMRHASRLATSTEPVTFLGVETARVSSTLTEQLGLDRGIGLVVQRVINDTAAAEVLKKHDILTKLDDQLLVSADQLGVLVRSKDADEEVTLTFIRGGKVQTAEVKLQTRKASTHASVIHMDGAPGGHTMTLHEGMGGHLETVRNQLNGITSKIDRVEIEKILSGLGHGGENGFTLVGSEAAPIVKMLNINNGNVVFSDDEGAIELKSSNGKKILIVKSSDGNVVFDGPVNSEEEREALEEAIRLRLEKVEGLETIELQTDGDFETEDVRVFSPKGGSVRVIRRGENHPIALPSSGA